MRTVVQCDLCTKACTHVPTSTTSSSISKIVSTISYSVLSKQSSHFWSPTSDILKSFLGFALYKTIHREREREQKHIWIQQKIGLFDDVQDDFYSQ
jgi:hypothetical protein